ncbi:protein sprint isoform X2 [Sitodiplosis mosellana]|uniref:protein sprint isoform X2 n=1 Tax=Sitodiplosis mosellana TaxID=263140 RepID=UPI0024449FBD|nr:protein sprint isoform X2 [Sitodiplosis mosellana]
MTTDDEVVIRPKTNNQPRAQSAYMTLLNSLATDLDLMLNDLRSTPPRFIQPRASFPIVSSAHFGTDAPHFLRPHRMPLGSVDSEDGNGLVDDELHTLLPGTREVSADDLSQSRASLVSSSDGGILAEGETSSSEASGDSTSPPCDLGLYERLLLTHQVWFLPGIQRAGAVHLLQGKEEGNFVVRGSSQANTMAVSVRLPPDTGPYIEHYLILSENGVLSLESSRFEFNSIPALIDHYAKCCDELPVQLTLPRTLREAPNRQQLSSLALLGQEFWRYPMANPRPSANTSPTPVSTASKTESSGLGTTMFSANQHKIVTNSQHTVVSGNVFSPSTPSDTASSLSSFTSTGQQILSPESMDSVMLTMSPVDSCQTGIIGKTSTFKTQNRKSLDLEKLTTFSNRSSPPNAGLDSNINNNAFNEHNNGNIRGVRPTPPSTLNVIPLRIPPAPPPRWTKPSSQSPTDSITPTATEHFSSTNFTMTTTMVTEISSNVQKQCSPFVEILSPNANTAFQTISKRMSPEGECKTSADTLSSQGSKRWQSQSSKDSSQNNRKVVSPTSQVASNRTKRSRARKESKHYQESDILESPQVYCRSALGDKISDYEDLWSQENGGSNSSFGKGPALSSFRSEHRPDLLPETPTVTSLSDNILSPIGSISSSASQQNAQKLRTPSEHSSSPGFDDENGVVLRQNAKNQMEQNNNECQKLNDLLSPSMEINRLQIAADFAQESMLQQPRNRLGLLLTPTTEIPPPMNDSTPVQTPSQTQCKRDSPFYAEPADALAQSGNVVRRSQRVNGPPKSQRHSEPPKAQSRNTQFCQVLSPIDSEKSHHISGSLDELKKKPRGKPIRSGRLDPWPVDSSWEFMGNDDQNDYDTDANWKLQANISQNGEHPKKSPNLNSSHHNVRHESRLTINQIIAQKLPDLKISELLQKTTIPANSSPELSRNDATMTSFGKSSRLSAYDNVERAAHSGYGTSMMCHDSHSDDGTVFSEPWDSSQWDSFLPHDDTISESIHLSKCRPVICNSEDDTIMEEFSQHQKENYAPRHHQPQKIATILRSRSCRDREVLSHPRNKTTTNGPGDSIAAYALTLAQDSSSTFARNIENFISCTKESRELSPQIIMRNMRQFMSGMKNYLVKHGEGNFQQEVLRARSMLKSDEFLNLDTILEGVMHQLVVLPLREHLYGLFVDYYTGTGDIQLLVENVKASFGKSPTDFGLRPCIKTPSPTAMQRISLLILRLQEAELPLAKLDILLSIVTSIIEATTNTQSHALGADDFLPLLVYIVAKCGFIGAEIEAEFMWCLLQPSLLNGEAGYYLTALCSAVHVLKSFITNEQDGTGSLDFRSSSLPACSSVLRVIIPDEYNGSLQTRTLPIRPHTTTREVCRIIAHKARVTNPQDYALFKLVDGEETLLLDSDCPQEIRLTARGKPCMLAYKRIDAKIAWPTTSQAFQ